MRILELRLLPSLAIGRLGAARSPMDNYEAVVDPARPLGYRTLVPAETLEVDPETGEIARAFVPSLLQFTDGALVRPVAPFLEVWARVSRSTLIPLTVDILGALRLKPSQLQWHVRVGNYKIWRRTHHEKDKIDAQVDGISDHLKHELRGCSKHFWAGEHLPLGWVQYIRPNAAFPEIRLRFTPARGLVYGSSRSRPGPGAGRDPNVARHIYKGGRTKNWLGYADDNSFETTSPTNIYATTPGGTSRGYIDDECDGVVEVVLEVAGRKLSAQARIGAGPPAYAPDSFPVRSVADEIEQALFGPTASAQDASHRRVEEIVRRAFETVRLMNVAAMNGNAVDGQPASTNNMVGQDFDDTGRAIEPIMAPGLVDRSSIEGLHQNVLAALSSGAAPWFVDVLREYNEVADLTDKGRRKMPAMMRGADGRYLALTRRQLDIIRRVAKGPIFEDSPPLAQKPRGGVG